MARKVLVLHGYSQNANIFSKRLGALRKQCGKDVEMVFVDGPFVLEAADLPENLRQFSESLAENAVLSGSAPEAETNLDPALTPRGWWKTNAERTISVGLAETLITLRDYLKGHEFDGVLGFSQGAALASLLSALLERPHIYPPFLVDGQPPHPPFQFCIEVAGFRPAGHESAVIFDQPYKTLTLHVIGKTDVVVTEERSTELVAVSANKRVETHEGGHFVPSKTTWRKFLVDFMKNPSIDVPSPSISESAPSSGTATPLELDVPTSRI